MGLLLVALALLSFVEASAIVSGPSEGCGWLVLNGVEPSGFAATAMAQGCLAQVFGASDAYDSVTGLWTKETTELLEDFQAFEQISVSPVLGPQSWNALVNATSPSILTRSQTVAPLILAIQMALQDYSVDIFISDPTGVWGESTETALSKFLSARRSKAEATSRLPYTLDFTALHLLATNCNGSGFFFMDVGWPQGVLSVKHLQCYRKSFDFVLFESWREFSGFWPACVENWHNAISAGFKHVGLYYFPQRFINPKFQAAQWVSNTTMAKISTNYLMLDIEGSDWPKFSAEKNRAFLSSLKHEFSVVHKQKLGVYCTRIYWLENFGDNYTEFADTPLWYPHYDGVPALGDFAPFGGWFEASGGKQFSSGAPNEAICNLPPLDWDFAVSPYWEQ
jgi:hypothetical protein